MSPDVTIVVPLFNEQESVEPLCEAVASSLGEGITFELLLVDDGSKDSTLSVARSMTRTFPQVRVIQFRRNYGQTPAMAAGIDHARGRVIVTMDGDLQNDPRDIPMMLQKMDEGYDIVVGWRHNRQDKLVSRKIPSKIANWLIGKVTGIPIRDNGCSLKAFRADLIKQVPLYSEMHRFIPAMASVAGPRVAQVKVRHHARQFGESKYGLSRIYKVLFDLITIKTLASFTARPLLWFATLSAPFMLGSFAVAATGVYVALSRPDQSPLVLFGVSALFGSLGFFLLFAGMVGELIYKTGDVDVHKFSTLTAKTTRLTQ